MSVICQLEIMYVCSEDPGHAYGAKHCTGVQVWQGLRRHKLLGAPVLSLHWGGLCSGNVQSRKLQCCAQ